MIAKINYNITTNRNGYVNRKGTREVVIELYQLGSRATINTHIYVTAGELLFGRFQECCPLRVEYTRIIDEMVQELTRIEMEIICSHRECTPRKLREAWKNNLSRSALLSDFMESVVGPSSRKANTKASYRTLVKGLEEFMPGLRIKDINYDFLERWVNWQRDVKGMKENTIIGRLKALRCLMREAIKRDVLTVDEDPFKAYTIGEMKAKKEFLTEPELQRLGGFAKHDKNFGDSSLAEYKSTCSFLIGSTELKDSNKWTDIPQRVFSYVVVINFGLENCIQYVFNETTTFYYRNYNGGSLLWSSWKKVRAEIM